MDFTITKDELETLAKYLVTRPWAEVNHLVQLLQKVATPAQAPAPAPVVQAVPDLPQEN